MAKKLELQKLKDELFTVMKSVRDSIERAHKRLHDMMISNDEIPVELGVGVMALQTVRQEKSHHVALMTSQVLGPESDSRGTSLSKHELLSMKAKFEEALAEDDAIHVTIDEMERKFCKYKIPERGPDNPEPLEAYLARVRDFMRRIWRETAESSRRKEYKCLLEWMDEIDRSDSEELRTVLVDLGVEISGFLVEYLWMISAERLEDVEAVIGCLGIEEGSAVIGCFTGVVELFERTVGMVKRVKPDEKLEAELFRRVLVEILRLEVAFRSPDLPMRLMSLMYDSMAYHLRENVFKDKLDAIRDKIELESQRRFMTESFEEILNSGVKEIWQELGLK